VQIIKDSSAINYTFFSVTLSSVASVYSNGTLSDNYTSNAQFVILNSGTTLTYLPENVAQSIMDTFNATYSNSLGYATCCCLLPENSDLSLKFQFGGSGGPTIVVDLNELVLQTGSNIGFGPGGSPGASDNCVFGVSISDSIYLLNDTFLRFAYVVYDLDNKKIALAQSNLNFTSSTVTSISEGDGIPGVSSTATAVVASSTSSSGGSTNHKSSGLKMAVAPYASLLLGVIFGALLLI
jgi:hypothetical protein